MLHLRFYRAILSHECATLTLNKVADAATVELQLHRCDIGLRPMFARFMRNTSLYRGARPRPRLAIHAARATHEYSEQPSPQVSSQNAPREALFSSLRGDVAMR